VRAVPDALARCEITWIDRERIDVGDARRAHAAYCRALADAGLRVVVADADEAHPDCPFVEDLLLEVGATRVLCNPGAPSRRGEREGVLRALAEVAGPPPVTMPDHLQLDGGDVLQLSGRVFVGRSTRTGSAAIDWLRDVVDAEVIEVPLDGPRLHLKTAGTALDDRTVLVADEDVADSIGALLRESVPGLEIVVVPGGEGAAANVLRLPDGALLVAGGFPATAALLEGRAYAVRTVDIEPFARAEAGLTCLSVLLREPQET
jgi:dimethylargininase